MKSLGIAMLTLSVLALMAAFWFLEAPIWAKLTANAIILLIAGAAIMGNLDEHKDNKINR